MGKVIFHPEARDELLKASLYYEDCRTGLGREFLAAVEAIIALVHSHPETGRMMHESYRRVLVARFPYGIIYRATDTVIYIVAIMHLKRKPGYWLERMQDG